MTVQDKRKNPRSMAMSLDLLHIIVGIVVVVFTVLVFVKPEKYKFLLPLIFWLAAALNAANAWFRLKAGVRDKSKRQFAFALCVMAVALFVVGVLSAISMWG